MICVYSPDAIDFSTNGIGPVAPKTCTVTETLNGEWEVEMDHPIDAFGKWQRLVLGRIVRVPVPAAETPRIELTSTGSSREIRKVNTPTNKSLRLRSGTGTIYKNLGQYREGTEVVVLDKSNASWYEVACPDGKRGYMYASYLDFVRNETTVVGIGKTVAPRQLRDQPFRIYRTAPSLTGIKVYARHIFYDLADNMIVSYSPASTDTGATVAAQISARCEDDHPFTFYSDLDTTADEVTFENSNPVDAILSDGGLVEKYAAELSRDWFDVFLVARVGKDTGIRIAEGKNLKSVTYDADDTDVVTRIMPTGEKKDGKILYLDEKYIDSPRIGDYPHPKWYSLPVEDAKVDDDVTEAQAKTKMRAAVQAEFDKGCDLPVVTVTVDFVNAADTVEFAQYHALQNIFLGDTVQVYAKRIGLSIAMRMTQYTFNCLTGKYDKIVLGVATEALEGSTITGKQLPNGEIRGGVLVPGTVGGLQLKDGAVGNLHIQNAAINIAHINQAAIEQLSADSIVALKARLQELIAGIITTDELYAAFAAISQMAVDHADIKDLTTDNLRAGGINADRINADTLKTKTLDAVRAYVQDLRAGVIDADEFYTNLAYIVYAQIAEADIAWANIENLTTEVGNIARAEIVTAAISYAHITDLFNNRLFTDVGTAGEFRANKLIIDQAQIADLTVNAFRMVSGDGKVYSITVDEDGELATEYLYDEADWMVDGTPPNGFHAVATSFDAGDITAGTLYVTGEASFMKVIARYLTVDEAYINNLTAWVTSAQTIQAIGQQNTFIQLIDGKITSAVGNIKIGGRNLERYTGDFSEGWNKYEDNLTGTNHGWTIKAPGSDAWSAQDATTIEVRATNETGGFGLYAGVSNLKKNTEYTISFYLAGNRMQKDVTYPGYVQWFMHSGWSFFPCAGDIAPAATGQYPHISDYLRVVQTFDTGDYTDFELWLFGREWGNDGVFWFSRPKLELGNKATDWTPAPEDTDARVASAETRITQTEQAVAIKASQAEVNTLSETVSTHSGQLSVLAGQVAAKASQADVDELGDDLSAAEATLLLKANSTDVSAAIAAAANGLQAQINVVPSQISLAVGAQKFGGDNKLHNSGFNFPILDPNADPALGLNWSWIETGAPGTWQTWGIVPAGTIDWRPREANVLEIHAHGKSGVYGAQQWAKLSKNTAYTFSGFVRQDRMTDKIVVNVADVVDWTGLVYQNLGAPTGIGDYGSLNSFAHFSVTFDTGDHEWFRIAIWGENWPADTDGVLWLARLKLETGNVATAWTQASSEVVGASLLLNNSGMRFNGDTLDFDVAGTAGDLHLGPEGLVIDSIDSPSVLKRYTGPSELVVSKSATDAQVAARTHFRSLGDALAAIDGQYLPNYVAINLVSDTYYEGLVTLRGIHGRQGLYIYGNGATLANTELWFEMLGVEMAILNLSMSRRSGSDQCIGLVSCQYVYMNALTLTGTSTSDGSRAVLIHKGTNASIDACAFYGWNYAFMAHTACMTNSVNNKGNCKSVTVYATTIMNGTQPCTSTTFAYENWGGLVQNNGCTVDLGASAPSVPITHVATFAATVSHTVRGSSQWPGTQISTTDYIFQGYTEGSRFLVGELWFPGVSALTGKTILSVKLRLRRETGGWGDVVEITAYYGTRAYNSEGSPNPRYSMGVIGTIASGGGLKDFAIPTAAVEFLRASPTGACIAFSTGESAVASGKTYSRNYAKFNAVGSAYVPELVVTYSD
jgi:phage minor structural protein